MNDLVNTLDREDRLQQLVRRTGMYVNDGQLRTVVLDRLLALHDLHVSMRPAVIHTLEQRGIRLEDEPCQDLGMMDGREPSAGIEPVLERAHPASTAFRPEDKERYLAVATSLIDKHYRGRIRRHATLNPDEHIGLALLMRVDIRLDEELPKGYRSTLAGGSFPARAFDVMIEHNLRLAWSISGEYVGQGLDIEDLKSHSGLGLIRAVEKWDATRGFTFSTYATHWIRQSITRALANEGTLIRLPVHVVERIKKVEATFQRLRLHQFRVSADDVAAALDITTAEVRQLLDYRRATYSLDRPIHHDDEGATLTALLTDDVDVDTELLEVDRRTAIDRVLGTLSEREAGVIRMRFGFVTGEPMTLEDIGQHYGVTRERIRQIESKTMSKLRDPIRLDRMRGYLG